MLRRINQRKIMSDKSDIERKRDQIGKHPETNAAVESAEGDNPKAGSKPNIRPGDPEKAGERIKEAG